MARAQSTPGDDEPHGIQNIEPGVDPAAARSSKVAGDDALAAAGLVSPGESGRDQKRRGRGLWLAVGAGIGIIAIVVFILCLPLAPALAWIGIALQVALFAALAASAFAFAPGRYRASRFAWLTGFMGVSAVVILLIILVVAWTSGT
jgi:hypothetical protein